jgi:hypothetical protein
MTVTPIRYVIRFAALAGVSINGVTLQPGDYLAEYDPDGMDGNGVAVWSSDPAQAMEFRSVHAARKTYGLVSIVKPVRDDGRPNRPLTAYTVVVEPRRTSH